MLLVYADHPTLYLGGGGGGGGGGQILVKKYVFCVEVSAGYQKRNFGLKHSVYVACLHLHSPQLGNLSAMNTHCTLEDNSFMTRGELILYCQLPKVA